MDSETGQIERVEHLIDTLITSFQVLADDLHAFNLNQTSPHQEPVEKIDSVSHESSDPKSRLHDNEIQLARERGYDAVAKLRRHIKLDKARSGYCLMNDEVLRDARNDITSRSNEATAKNTQQCQRSRVHSNPVLDPTYCKENIEQDHTTIGGNPSTLQCPFASKLNTASSKSIPTPPPTRYNPGSITAKSAGEQVSPPPSITDSAPKCPIRYLDQHSPEELATYFENHKHEIPRSHEVCVKRYRTNTESVRLLDAKYGSLVNMIQGLGVKHQPLLPNEEEATIEEGQANERVERWAERLPTRADTLPFERPSTQEDERTGHFERPLKEIRVGESPSRPWGISVPIVESQDQNCPLHRGSDAYKNGRPTIKEAGSEKVTQYTSKSQESKSAAHPSNIPSAPANYTIPNNPNLIESPFKTPDAGRMIFTGPVFIGYSPGQADEIIKAMGLSKKDPS